MSEEYHLAFSSKLRVKIELEGCKIDRIMQCAISGNMQLYAATGPRSNIRKCNTVDTANSQRSGAVHLIKLIIGLPYHEPVERQELYWI